MSGLILVVGVPAAYFLVNGWFDLLDWLDRRYATVEDYERHKAAKRAKHIGKKGRATA